jgi:hypothetical protein
LSRPLGGERGPQSPEGAQGCGGNAHDWEFGHRAPPLILTNASLPIDAETPWSSQSFGQPIDLDCDGSSPDLVDFTISIYHDCDRWVDISGMSIVDKPFRNIEKLIDELLVKQLYLPQIAIPDSGWWLQRRRD